MDWPESHVLISKDTEQEEKEHDTKNQMPWKSILTEAILVFLRNEQSEFYQ